MRTRTFKIFGILISIGSDAVFTEQELTVKINKIRDRLIIVAQNDHENAIKNMYALDLNIHEIPN